VKKSQPTNSRSHGAFVVQFQQGKTEEDPGIAIICAPLCVDHYANILTDSDDVSLAGIWRLRPREYTHGYVYRFKEDRRLGSL